MSTSKGSHESTEAFRILRELYQLSIDLYSSESRQDLRFRVLNHTINLFPYHRAVLWSFDNGRPKLIGVSGREDVNRKSPRARLWRDLVTSLEEKKTPQILDSSPVSKKGTWKSLVEQTSGLSVMWIPLAENGDLRAGLMLERWGDDVWDVGECEIMESLAQGISPAWTRLNPQIRWHNRKPFSLPRIATAVAAVLVFFLLYFQTTSLRIVAPCEIVPKDIEMVAAPLEGVIKEVLIQPGDPVKKGELLFSYEDRIVIQELKVAQKQVQIIKSQYDRARVKAFTDPKALEEIQSLKYRLEQEKIRQKLAESKAKHLHVRASTSGISMVDNPEDWRGRPVKIGERVVMIFDPRKKKVKIFLPENDNIRFDRERPVHIILNADPGSKYDALLHYVAPQTSVNPQGGASFVAEAALSAPHAGIAVGSKGFAIVYGDEVRLGYWLLRKPLAAIRHFLGI